MEHFLLEMLTNQIIKYIPLQQGLRQLDNVWP